jgi:hypothetical protein
MDIILIAVFGLLIPLLAFFVGVTILISIEWCLHRSTHFTIRDALLAMTLFALALSAAKFMLSHF